MKRVNETIRRTRFFFFSRRGKERASIYDSRVVGSMQSNFVCVELMVYVSFFDLSISFNLTCKRMMKIKKLSSANLAGKIFEICRNIIFKEKCRAYRDN